MTSNTSEARIVPMSQPELVKTIRTMTVRYANGTEPYLATTLQALIAYMKAHPNDRTTVHAQTIQQRRTIERQSEKSAEDALKLEGLKRACNILKRCEACAPSEVQKAASYQEGKIRSAANPYRRIGSAQSYSSKGRGYRCG